MKWHDGSSLLGYEAKEVAGVGCKGGLQFDSKEWLLRGRRFQRVGIGRCRHQLQVLEGQ